MIVIQNDQMHHSEMENNFKLSLLCKIFSILHTLKKSNKTCEYQSDGLDNNLIETNHEEFS